VINLNWVKRHYIQCNLVNMMLIYYFFRISNLTEWWNLTWHWKIGPKSFYFPVSFAKGSLDGNSLEVEKLNQVDLSRIVTRHTEQHLSDPLQAEDLILDGQLVVRGKVNGQNLSEEYANTLMVRRIVQFSFQCTTTSITD